MVIEDHEAVAHVGGLPRTSEASNTQKKIWLARGRWNAAVSQAGR